MPAREAALRPHDALLIIDVQNDFLPDGALGVADGQAVIAPLNRCISAFHQGRRPIFATRCWHPPQHCSFRERGGPWPPHCIAGTTGAAFAAELALPAEAHIVSKAIAQDTEAYSGFQGTDLAAQLHSLGCQRVFIGGLATDYCVRATALDARTLGLEVVLLEDAVRAVDVLPGDGERALRELRERGVRLQRSSELA